jgi:hypothetical protein
MERVCWSSFRFPIFLLLDGFRNGVGTIEEKWSTQQSLLSVGHCLYVSAIEAVYYSNSHTLCRSIDRPI